MANILTTCAVDHVVMANILTCAVDHVVMANILVLFYLTEAQHMIYCTCGENVSHYNI
jgi:hypothetical protein